MNILKNKWRNQLSVEKPLVVKCTGYAPRFEKMLLIIDDNLQSKARIAKGELYNLTKQRQTRARLRHKRGSIKFKVD